MKKCLPSLIFLFLFNIYFTKASHSQTTLTAGDIAFIGFQSDNPDKFSFITFSDISALSTIHITEKGWLTSGGLRSISEGTIVWQAPVTGLTEGEIVTLTYGSPWLVSVGTVIDKSGSFALSTSGDQLLAFQVSGTNDTTFIAAINFNGDSWNVDVNSSNDSDIPTGLINLKTAVAIPENDNGVYSGLANGTANFLKTSINYPTNWTTSSGIISPWPSSFTISETTTISEGVTVEDLNIESTETLIVESGGFLTINDSLINDGNINLESETTTTGSLIADSISGTGMATVERNIPDWDWHIISSPVTGQLINSFATTHPLETDPDDGETSYDLAPYNEAANIWDPYFPQTGGTGDFVLGIGYSLRLTDNTGYEIYFTGILQTGTLKQTLSLTPSTGYGWHALGNPYTSAIKATGNDGTSFLEVNSSKLHASHVALYVWNDALVPPAWETYNNVTQKNIALGQGFVIRAASNEAEVEFNNNMKLHSVSETFKSAELPWQEIKVIVQSENNKASTKIAFNTGMTAGLDPSYDAGIFKPKPDLEICSRLIEDNGIDFTIQALPPVSNKTQRIPLRLDFAKGGEISFSIESENLPVNSSVIIEDTKKNIYTELNSDTGKYSTVLNAETKGNKQFYLQVNNNAATPVSSFTKSLFSVYSNHKIIYIKGPPQQNTSFELYGLDGKLKYKKTANNEPIITINGSDFPEGIYILRIIHSKHIQSEKLILK